MDDVSRFRYQADGCPRGVSSADMTNTGECCPTCGERLSVAEMLLCLRAEDQRRVCQTVLVCANRHAWSRWADRPEEPLRESPYPPYLDSRRSNGVDL